MPNSELPPYLSGVCVESKRGKGWRGGGGGDLLVGKFHMYKEAPFPLPCKL
jgi:hypothetical protein